MCAHRNRFATGKPNHGRGWALVALLVLALPSRAAPPEIAELSGPLVIVGGGKFPDEARTAYFNLAGKDAAKIVVIPTASADADDPKKADEFTKSWTALMPASVVILHTRDRKRADDPAFVEPLTSATAVWFSGGDQTRIVAAYRGTLVEKELKKLHARGGVIGGTSAGAAVMSDLMIEGGTDTAKLGPGLGLLPGIIVDQHFVARKRQARLEGAIAAHPGYVGLGIDEDTALVLRGRSGKVIGASTVTVCLGKGAGKPAFAEALKKPTPTQGDWIDLIQVRRAAANRAASQPFPPAKLRDPIVEKGTLVIVGGGGTTDDIKKRFLAAAGGPEALIVVIPTTEPYGPGDVKYIQSFGAKNVKLLHPKSRKQADDPAFSEMLLEAGGVWFGGGRQWNFVDSYEGTLTEKRFHDVLRRGGVIGGSSAGASIQSEFMPRGHPLGNTVMAAEGYERGFAFLPGCAVDQHFFARKRHGDMTGLMKQYPQYLGIGIDEATAIAVTGSTAEVLGRSKVAFYDTRKQPDGDTDYEVLTAGEKYDLKKREKVK